MSQQEPTYQSTKHLATIALETKETFKGFNFLTISTFLHRLSFWLACRIQKLLQKIISSWDNNTKDQYQMWFMGPSECCSIYLQTNQLGLCSTRHRSKENYKIIWLTIKRSIRSNGKVINRKTSYITLFKNQDFDLNNIIWYTQRVKRR